MLSSPSAGTAYWYEGPVTVKYCFRWWVCPWCPVTSAKANILMATDSRKRNFQTSSFFCANLNPKQSRSQLPF